MDVAARGDRGTDRTFLGHPIGLVNLFGVEVWERFSFYGMLTILGYYLYSEATAGGLGLPVATATGLVGAYGGLVFLSTALGGWVADRVLGMERTVLTGGVVVLLGHGALAVLPGPTGVGVGLVLVALGSGALKANTSSLLGTCYAKGDARVDGGFTLFYLGVNLGSFIGPLVTGLLQNRAGYHYAFGAAAVGMALGLTQYVAFRHDFGSRGREVPNPLSRSEIGRYLGVGAIAITVMGVASWTGLVTLASLPQCTIAVIGVASVAYFVLLLSSPRVEAVERRRVLAFAPLFVVNTVFWSLYQQIFTVLAVYSDTRVDWTILGWTAPSNWIGSIEPIWIIVASPLFALTWTRLGGRAPSTPRKFACGVFGMGVAFLLFVPLTAGSGKTVPAWTVAAILAVFAVSELMISPIGLSVTTRLAPAAFRVQMMALFFFSVGLGTSMSGFLARFYDPAHEAGYFGALGVVAVCTGVGTFAIARFVDRLSAGVH